MRAPSHRPDQGGFAVVMVIFLLFAVAVAGATGYQVVNAEFTMARQYRDSQDALAVARGTLQMFLGQTVGSVVGSLTHCWDDPAVTRRDVCAVVTARKVFELDATNHLYYLHSLGSVVDPRWPEVPARRMVGTYAWHRLAPVQQLGPLWVSGGTVTLSGTAQVNGTDADASGACLFSGTKTGLLHKGTLSPAGGGSFVQPAGGVQLYPDFAALYAATGVRWDVLASPAFTPDAQQYYPAFPPGAFPIVRFMGNHTTPWSVDGRGVLIVTGTLRIRSTGFRWEGIILAGALGSAATGWFPPTSEVSGMLIAGLNDPSGSVNVSRGTYRYHSCNAYRANRSLSYLEVVDGQIFEVGG